MIVTNPSAIRCPRFLFGLILAASSSLIFSGCSGGGGGGGQGQQTAFSVSGTISPAADAYIDADVNDPQAPYSANDSFDQAQLLPNPVILGGYLNEAGSGSPGRSFTDGDRNDYFLIRLFASQAISLSTADTGSRLGLYLFLAADPPGRAASVTNTDSLKIIPVDQTGDYVIRIRAENGASNYILSVGNNGSTSTPLDLHTDFFTGQAVVRFSDVMMAGTDRARFSNRVRNLGMSLQSGTPGKEVLLGFDARQSSTGKGDLRGKVNRFQTGGAFSLFPDLIPKLDTLRRIDELRRQRGVVYADPNYVRTALRVPDDRYYPLQWHYPVIGLPDAWDITTGRDDIVVAVVDSGVVAHPDLSGQLTADGYDFVSVPELALDGDGVDPDPQDPGEQPLGGSTFHGTHVAGTVAAQTDNTGGVAAAGWSTRVMAVRALGLAGVGSSYDILQAVRYAAGLPNDYGLTPAGPADIINLSLGGNSPSQAEQEVYTLVRQAGIVVVAAAGNQAAELASYPAAYDDVISVSAVDINGNPAPYANFGPTIDVAAPGGDMTRDVDGDGWPDGVLSTGAVDSEGILQIVYRFLQGTSMAAPHVAAVAALMKSVSPALTPDQLTAMLAAGLLTIDLGAAGRDDRYGYGLIDARKAVSAAASGEVPTSLDVRPGSVNLGTALATATLNAQKIGPGALEVTGISDDAAWLTVTASQTDAAGLGWYAVEVDRTGLAAGLYTAAITFDSTQNRVDIPVSLQVPTTIAAPHIGRHYVLLLDPVTYETRYQVAVRSQNGNYHYTFKDVAPGKYIVFAGTNFDQDPYIGDSGESSGAYLALDQPVIITVDRDMSGFNFSTEFNTNLFQSLTSIPEETRSLPGGFSDARVTAPCP